MIIGSCIKYPCFYSFCHFTKIWSSSTAVAVGGCIKYPCCCFVGVASTAVACFVISLDCLAISLSSSFSFLSPSFSSLSPSTLSPHHQHRTKSSGSRLQTKETFLMCRQYQCHRFLYPDHRCCNTIKTTMTIDVTNLSQNFCQFSRFILCFLKNWCCFQGVYSG